MSCVGNWARTAMWSMLIITDWIRIGEGNVFTGMCHSVYGGGVQGRGCPGGCVRGKGCVSRRVM